VFTGFLATAGLPILLKLETLLNYKANLIAASTVTFDY
jgi:hypothetical protein